ncbi:GNAT family N-acetyltransferase [Vibrio kasasachensis]|uniref:GNAT family N-acetyltransferase n=1 Tax=Vibrio kasasachensis TaxID=2910248 RepID=UPI003D0FD3CC
MFKIETKHLILRDMQMEDQTAFVELSQDAKYQRFYSEEDCDAEKYRHLTQLFIHQANEKPRRNYQLAIEHKVTEKFIGTVCLRLENDKQASIGCGLSRAYQGRGLIFEAARALADYGFMDLGVHRMYAETISKNRPAIRLCESLGMKQEGYFCQHRYFKNKWWDTVVLAVLRDNWRMTT